MGGAHVIRNSRENAPSGEIVLRVRGSTSATAYRNRLVAEDISPLYSCPQERPPSWAVVLSVSAPRQAARLSTRFPTPRRVRPPSGGFAASRDAPRWGWADSSYPAPTQEPGPRSMHRPTRTGRSYSCTEPNSPQLSTFQPVAYQPLCVTSTCRAVFNNLPRPHGRVGGI